KRITRELSSGLNFLRQGKFDGHVAVMVDDDMGDLARGLNTALSGLKERDNLKDSLAIASDIQRGLMPRGEPNVKGYAIAGFQQSCYSVGGDYYDYIQRANGSTWLIIADVAGKGYPAALTVANLQAMLHVLANSEQISLIDAASYINQALYQSLQGGRFVTVFMAELDPEQHTLEWFNAGHVPPLLWQHDQLKRLEATSPPLGMLEAISLQTQSVDLAMGNIIFACTDGITESRNSASELFADQRMETWFTERHQLDPSVLPSSLLARLDETGFNNRDDDITMLCLKRSNHDQPQ
ncbi:MAG: PP2C family protein-serine/threonine phosphatase, partial [Ghiorsea sp.]